jgi:hypothetical protein
MLNSSLFHAPSPECAALGECTFRTRATEQWRESIAAYDEIIQMLEGAADEDYGFVHGGAERVLLASNEIKQILEEHEREHGCWW